MEKFNRFRKEYERFVYKDYTIEKEDGCFKVAFLFSIPGLREFRSRWEFPIGTRDMKENDPILEKLVFNLGMVGETVF